MWNASHLAEGLCDFASLETSSHAANHTIPPPPSHEDSPHCPKDKNRSPFHGEKPIGFSPKANGFYPFGDATDLVRGRRW